MLKCREITEQASHYLDHNTSLTKRLAFRFHLMICHHCRHYMRQLYTTIGAIRIIDLHDDITPEDADNLSKRLLNDKGGDHKSQQP